MVNPKSLISAKTIQRFLILFFNASVFLTCWPAPNWVKFNGRLLHLSAVYFPLVGVGVGVFSAFVFYVFLLLFPPFMAVLLMMAASIYATGAFHEDGWADSCDALGGGYTPAAIRRIMKDSRLGTYGVTGLGFMLALKASALYALLLLTSPLLLMAVLVAGHALSRWFALVVMWRLPYVQDEEVSKSKPMAKAIKTLVLMRAALAPLMVLLMIVVFAKLTLMALLLALLCASLACIYWIFLLNKNLAGFTGDGLGAAQQLTEVVFYLALVAVLNSTIPLNSLVAP